MAFSGFSWLVVVFSGFIYLMASRIPPGLVLRGSLFQWWTGHVAVDKEWLRNMYRCLVSHPSRVQHSLEVLDSCPKLKAPRDHGAHEQRPLQDAQASEQVTERSRPLRSPFQCFTGHLAVGQKSQRNMYICLVSHPSRVHSLEVLDRCPKLKAPRNRGAQCTVPHGESKSSGNPRAASASRCAGV